MLTESLVNLIFVNIAEKLIYSNQGNLNSQLIGKNKVGALSNNNDRSISHYDAWERSFSYVALHCRIVFSPIQINLSQNNVVFEFCNFSLLLFITLSLSQTPDAVENRKLML